MYDGNKIEKTERVRLLLKIKSEEKSMLQNKAKSARMSVSQYVMRLVENKPIFVISDMTKFVVQLKRMGNNINQMTTVVNSQKYVDYEARKALKNNWRELEKIAADINKIAITVTSPQSNPERIAEIENAKTLLESAIQKLAVGS